MSRGRQAPEAEGQSRELIVPSIEQQCLLQGQKFLTPFPLCSFPPLPLLVSGLVVCLSVSSHSMYLTGWPQTLHSLPALASQVLVTGVSHHAQLNLVHIS